MTGSYHPDWDALVMGEAEWDAAWEWDAAVKRWRNRRTGDLLTEAELRQARQTFLDRLADESDRLAAQAVRREVTAADWRQGVSALLAGAIVVSLALARGGRERITDTDWDRATTLYRGQQNYLARFEAQVAQTQRALAAAGIPEGIAPGDPKPAEAPAPAGGTERRPGGENAPKPTPAEPAGDRTEPERYDLPDGALSEALIAARTASYYGSVTTLYGQTRAAMLELDLPAYPGDGSTECGQWCRCEWQIDEQETEWLCTWVLNADESCGDCLERAGEWNPLRVPKYADDGGAV